VLLASTRGNPDAVQVLARADIPVPRRGAEPPPPFSVDRKHRSVHAMIEMELPATQVEVVH
jgi:hypothetical protein